MNAVEFILSKSVSPNFYGPPRLEFIENSHEVPLVYACLNGSIEMVNLLLSKNACVNVKYCDIQPLYAACKSNSLECVKAVLEKNPTIESVNGPEKLTPLEAAAKNNSSEIIKLLVERGAGTLGTTKAIAFAISSGEIDALQYLLSVDGFMPSDTDKAGNVFLLYAVKENKYKAAKLLIEGGYVNDINWKDEKGLSPLFISSLNGNLEIMTLLLENKADIEVKNLKGATPLCVACQEGNSQVVSLLLDWEANINVTFSIGVTPLYLACQNNHIHIVKLLIEAKTDIDKREGDEMTPLFVAVSRNYTDIVEYLLKNGASVSITSKKGTILSVAKTQQMKQILISHGAK